MSDSGKAVFLSYASQDAEAAKRICDVLRQAGVEVWFDQSELVGGDAWDQKIRKQIKDCALLIPIISAATQARTEGYFRLEWRLADQRTHLMAKGRAFLLPVVIDDTRDAEAHVPDSFTEVQWTRLSGGETPPAFAERVRKLLGGDVGRDLRIPPTAEKAGFGDPALQKKSPRWLAPVIAGIVIALLALFIARPWEKAPSPTVPAKAIETATGAVLTSAQELVAKARTILEQGDELNRETYALAEELLIKAEVLDVTEASAWILHAKVSASRIGFGLDRSAARHEALRTQTGRAIQLAPESLDAQLAECDAFRVFEQDVPTVITRLQALAAKHPDDWRVPAQLSQCYLVAGKLAEALVANTRAMQLSPDNPRLKGYQINLLVLAGLWAEAETSIATMLQGRTGARLLAHHVYLKLLWSGDLAGAATAVRSWPAWFLLEDRGVGHAALVALWNRDPGSALAVVRKFPRDYIRDFLFTGPTAVLSAWANEQAGNVESARADWRVVQQVAERELQSAPNDPYALHWKAWALARLGDTPAAASILQQLLERNASLSALGQFVGRLGGLALTVGRTDLALTQIALNPPGSRAITKTDLRLNPLFDPLRSDPRFQAVIDAALGPADKREIGATSAVPSEKSVAVLAFANLSDDRANEYFSDGISEELLNVLAKVPKLKVAARTSSFYFKGKEVPIPEIAKQLGVAYVVEGSVRKSGNKVRITAQLIKAADGFHVWSETYDRDLTDIFAVQDEIAKNILGIVRNSVLGETELPHATTTKIEAYTLFLQGQGAFGRRGVSGLEEAIRLFEAALAIDPDYVPALVGLAQARVLVPVYANLSGAKAAAMTASGRKAAQRALELDPRNATAQVVLGWVMVQTDWRWSDGLERMLRARELAPNNAWIWNILGDHYRFVGDLPQALAAKRREWELDPLSSVSHWDFAYTYQVAGDYDQTLYWAERAIVLAPHNLDSYMSAILISAQTGRLEKMRTLLAAARREVHENEGMLLLLEARAAIAEKKTDEARRIMAKVVPLVESGDSTPAYLGYLYLLLGESDQAAHWLQQGYERHDSALVWPENIDFDVIVANPKTRPILDQPGLKELYELRQRNARAGLNKL